MTLLPWWLAAYLMIGSALLALIAWRSPCVMRPPAHVVASWRTDLPPAWRLSFKPLFILGSIAGFTLLWPIPLARSIRDGWQLVRAAWRHERSRRGV